MRVLIQNCLTNKFLDPRDGWTPEAAEAQDFEKTLRAWAAIEEKRLSGVRIVLQVGNGVPDVQLATVGSRNTGAASNSEDVRRRKDKPSET